MGGRVAGWLREKLIDEPLADPEAETTVYSLQLVIYVPLISVLNSNGRSKMITGLRAPIAVARASDIWTYGGCRKKRIVFPYLFAPVTKINCWLELAAHGGRPITYTDEYSSVNARFNCRYEETELLSSLSYSRNDREYLFPVDQSRSVRVDASRIAFHRPILGPWELQIIGIVRLFQIQHIYAFACRYNITRG